MLTSNPTNMFTSVLAKRFTTDLANMFTIDLRNMFTSDLANMLTSDSVNMFTSELANIFTSELEKYMKKIRPTVPRKPQWGKTKEVVCKWCSVCLRTKWLWVWFPLQSIIFKILHLFRAKRSLTFRQLQIVGSF